MAFAFGQFNEFSDSVTIRDSVIEAVARAINLGPFVGRFYQAMGAQPECAANGCNKHRRGGDYR